MIIECYGEMPVFLNEYLYFFPKPCIDNTITTQRIIGELNADNLNRYKTNPISQELTVARCTNPGDEREESIYNTDNIFRYCEASEFNRQNDGWF